MHKYSLNYLINIIEKRVNYSGSMDNKRSNES